MPVAVLLQPPLSSNLRPAGLLCNEVYAFEVSKTLPQNLSLKPSFQKSIPFLFGPSEITDSIQHSYILFLILCHWFLPKSISSTLFLVTLSCIQSQSFSSWLCSGWQDTHFMFVKAWFGWKYFPILYCYFAACYAQEPSSYCTPSFRLGSFHVRHSHKFDFESHRLQYCHKYAVHMTVLTS